MQGKCLGLGAKTGIFILLVAFISFPIFPAIALAEAEEEGTTKASGTKEGTRVVGTETVAAEQTRSDTPGGGDSGKGGTEGLSPVAVGGITAAVLGVIGLTTLALSDDGGGGGTTATHGHPGK
jgi:hypothetical protein